MSKGLEKDIKRLLGAAESWYVATHTGLKAWLSIFFVLPIPLEMLLMSLSSILRDINRRSESQSLDALPNILLNTDQTYVLNGLGLAIERMGRNLLKPLLGVRDTLRRCPDGWMSMDGLDNVSAPLL
jgi:hypothetical protein